MGEASAATAASLADGQPAVPITLEFATRLFWHGCMARRLSPSSAGPPFQLPASLPLVPNTEPGLPADAPLPYS